MAKFRHHNTAQVIETTSDEKAAEYDADELWQRLDDLDDTPAQSVDAAAKVPATRKS